MSSIPRRLILDEPGLSIMRPDGVLPDLGTALSVGGSIIGGMMQKDAAGQAADAQTQSAEAATAEQRRQYDLTRKDALSQYGDTRADNAQFLSTGAGANQRLATLLGIRQSKTIPQSSRSSSGTAANGGAGRQKIYDALYANADAQHRAAYGMPLAQGDPTGLAKETEALNSAADQQYAAEQTASQDKGVSRSNDAAFSGWLKGQLNGVDPSSLDATQMDWFQKDYNNKTGFSAGNYAGDDADNSTDADFGSLTKKFSADDLSKDAVYNSGLQFGLDTGTKAINARAIASGGYDSGATLKALTQFGNDYGSTKAGDAYNRYTNDQTNTYNKLAGVSGAGQNAVSTVTNAGNNMVNTIANAGANSANNISNNVTGAGNSRAASIVGGSQAWGSAAQGVNNAYNNYQSNQTLQALLKRNGTSSNFSPYAAQYDLSNPQYG